jgi:hypothetical protein
MIGRKDKTVFNVGDAYQLLDLVGEGAYGVVWYAITIGLLRSEFSFRGFGTST